MMQEGPFQYQQMLANITDPCPACGMKAQITTRLFRIVPKSILSLGNGAKPGQIEANAQGVEGFNLCLYCLRRERMEAEDNHWQTREVLSMEIVQEEG